MARGRISNLTKSGRKAFNKVAKSRGNKRCGRSPRGPKKEVCLSPAQIPGWSCGYNRVNNLFACVNTRPRSRREAAARNATARDRFFSKRRKRK